MPGIERRRADSGGTHRHRRRRGRFGGKGTVPQMKRERSPPALCVCGGAALRNATAALPKERCRPAYPPRRRCAPATTFPRQPRCGDSYREPSARLSARERSRLQSETVPRLLTTQQAAVQSGRSNEVADPKAAGLALHVEMTVNKFCEARHNVCSGGKKKIRKEKEKKKSYPPACIPDAVILFPSPPF